MAEDIGPDDEKYAEAKAFWEGTLVAPAVYSNQVASMDVAGGVRVTFGEMVADGPVFVRSAVMLADYQAFHLWEMLGASEAVGRVRSFIAEQQKNEP